MRFRAFAFILALVLVGSPLLGVVCEMDCDTKPATASCHESTADGATVRGGQHPCDHDHASSTPALLASANARDFAVTLAPVPATTPHSSWVSPPRLTAIALHGPPRLIGTSTSLRSTVLRI